MNKLLIQNLNDKFINNLSLSKTDFCDIISTDIRNTLYQLYYQHKFTHIIFVDSLLNHESFQFIDEFGSDVMVYVYKNSTSDNYRQTKKIAGILSYTKDNDDSYKTIKIPTLVNHELYNANQPINKIHQIISFLDQTNKIPEDLQNYLYPQKSLPIKLFNNSDIIHPQNLGLLSERDKALLLQESKYYLAITEDYVAEAWACGCKVLTVGELDSCEPSIYKNSKTFQSYTNFLKGLIGVKK